MADVVVTTREDREAAVGALCRGKHFRQGYELVHWEDTGELKPYDVARAIKYDGFTHAEAAGRLLDYRDEADRLTAVAAALASARIAAEARGRAAERERCAGMVREMAGLMDNGAMDACDDAESEAWKLCAEWTRDLAERIGKGEA